MLKYARVETRGLLNSFSEASTFVLPSHASCCLSSVCGLCVSWTLFRCVGATSMLPSDIMAWPGFTIGTQSCLVPIGT